MNKLLYDDLVQTYEKVESTSGNIAKIEVFSDLLKQADQQELSMIMALTIGKLHPDWKGEPEIGIAEKMAIQVITVAASVSEKKVNKKLKTHGDIGLVAERLLSESAQTSLFSEEPTVEYVYKNLDQISKLEGAGSSKLKISKLAGLLTEVSPLGARYILRTVAGDLRLGLGAMMIIESLSLAFTGSRENKNEIEKAFNITSDLGEIARCLAEEGMDAIKSTQIQVGRPIRMMAAKKLSDSSEILEKAGGRALVEYKYDGERVQIHKDDEVYLFSRRHEEISSQYPDVVEYVIENIDASKCVLEAECVAVDPETEKLRPFQELMRRRRKTDIEQMIQEVPVALFFFDILYLDGKDVTDLPMLKRRALLEKIVKTSDRISLTVGEVIDDPERLDSLFMESIELGLEGVIAKAVHENSSYQAGSRSWLWIKLKASYKEDMTDSIDVVVVGAMYGRGKRKGVYGAILASVYDVESDTFPTICKIGTGFTDDMLIEFKNRLEQYRTEMRDSRIVSEIEADVWFKPVEVIEVIGDEITISPIHPAGQGVIDEGGLAIRFPRFTGRWREDKGPTQATTVKEIVEIFLKKRDS
jgi:DNA ligase-1